MIFVEGVDSSGPFPRLCGAVWIILSSGSAVRLLGVSSLNSARALARPFFFARSNPWATRSVSAVFRQYGLGRDVRQHRDLVVDRRKIGTGRGEQLPEIVNNEVGLLIAVDVVLRPHDAPQIEAQPVRVRVLQAIGRFAGGGEDSRAVDPQSVGGRD